MVYRECMNVESNCLPVIDQLGLLHPRAARSPRTGNGVEMNFSKRSILHPEMTSLMISVHLVRVVSQYANDPRTPRQTLECHITFEPLDAGESHYGKSRLGCLYCGLHAVSERGCLAHTTPRTRSRPHSSRPRRGTLAYRTAHASSLSPL